MPQVHYRIADERVTRLLALGSLADSAAHVAACGRVDSMGGR